MGPEQVNELIRKRRSIFPKAYMDRPIPKAIIEEILENANWAPTHKRTEPWRFQVLTDGALQRLSDFLGGWYEANTPADKFSEMKLKKTKMKPLAAACVIAICMQRDSQESLPEWEEIAAVAAAVQNMWLSCTAYGIGAYWSSPRSITEGGASFFKLPHGQRCLGLFYMGYHQMPELPGKRDAIHNKTIWLSE